jgi:hypothetical protein
MGRNAMNLPTLEDHHNWKGDDASYISKHEWITRYYGKADHCEVDPHHLSGSRYHWHNISGEYKRNKEDWVQLCSSCHRRRHPVPKKAFCIHGHEFTEDNTRIDKYGWRYCRICRRAGHKNWRDKRRDLIGVMICQKILLDHGLLISLF